MSNIYKEMTDAELFTFLEKCINNEDQFYKDAYWYVRAELSERGYN
jgi:hypothetical protein